MLSWTLIPDTSSYLIAGYLVFSLVILSYLMSLYLRWRNTRRDYLRLEKEKK
jgi:hypothetical protein